MSTATNGRAREHRVMRRMEDAGWLIVMRSAGSKGPADNPDDCMPMTCVRVIDHEGDHRPAGIDGTIWCTWADEEAVS